MTTWHYEYNAYTTSDGKEIPAFEITDGEGNKIADTNEDTPSDTQEANASLIAAAPDLLAACERAIAAMRDEYPEHVLQEGDYPAFQALENAIARARGQA